MSTDAFSCPFCAKIVPITGRSDVHQENVDKAVKEHNLTGHDNFKPESK